MCVWCSHNKLIRRRLYKRFFNYIVYRYHIVISHTNRTILSSVFFSSLFFIPLSLCLSAAPSNCYWLWTSRVWQYWCGDVRHCCHEIWMTRNNTNNYVMKHRAQITMSCRLSTIVLHLFIVDAHRNLIDGNMCVTFNHRNRWWWLQRWCVDQE